MKVCVYIWSLRVVVCTVYHAVNVHKVFLKVEVVHL